MLTQSLEESPKDRRGGAVAITPSATDDHIVRRSIACHQAAVGSLPTSDDGTTSEGGCVIASSSPEQAGAAARIEQPVIAWSPEHDVVAGCPVKSSLPRLPNPRSTCSAWEHGLAIAMRSVRQPQCLSTTRLSRSKRLSHAEPTSIIQSIASERGAGVKL